MLTSRAVAGHSKIMWRAKGIIAARVIVTEFIRPPRPTQSAIASGLRVGISCLRKDQGYILKCQFQGRIKQIAAQVLYFAGEMPSEAAASGRRHSPLRVSIHPDGR